nr:hypothetical protein [uncultured Arsenicibacter sp.]
MKRARLFSGKTILFVLLICHGVAAQRTGTPIFSPWKAGYLDIHQINTGRGNATFCILPDGTTLLIDAGAIDPINWRDNKPRNNPVRPDDSRQPGEWIARYIRRVMPVKQTSGIDYLLITHFHDDHVGTPKHASRTAAGGYKLSGVTELAEFMPIRRILDRGWPDYTFPQTLRQDSIVINYVHFLENRKIPAERFVAGRLDQIRLVHDAKKYQSQFSIRNLAVNGDVWTGKGQDTRHVFPDLTSVPANQQPNENMCSAVFTMRYGDFDYFAGGDIQGVLPYGAPAWHDVETPVAAVAGPVDVQLLDHHGYADSQNGALMKALRPRVFVVPAWAVSHPGPAVAERLFDEAIYPGERDVFVTQLFPEAKATLGPAAAKIKPETGHIVIRVQPGGATYQVLVLDDADESMRIKAVYGPYQSR